MGCRPYPPAAAVRKRESYPFVFALTIFMLSMFLVLVRGWGAFVSVKFYSAMFLTLLFTGSLVAAIAVTINRVTQHPRNEIASLGFAHVFFGSFVRGAEPDWMLSLTVPPSPAISEDTESEDTVARAGEPKNVAEVAAVPSAVEEEAQADETTGVTPTPTSADLEAASNDGVPASASPPGRASLVSTGTSDDPGAGSERRSEFARPTDSSGREAGVPTLRAWRAARARVQHEGFRPTKGFGAPLWVLLLSVLGAGVYTINLVVDIVGKRQLFDGEEARPVLKDMVQHQVFTLVAPLTAIFIYQSMVAIDLAENALPVALAALASGLALNSLLVRAMHSALGRAEGSESSSR
jgi:hypothetical protein